MARMVLLLVAFLVSALPLQAAPISFVAALDGPSESPSNASPGTGSRSSPSMTFFTLCECK